MTQAAMAQTPRPALLVLEKDDHMLAIADPVAQKVVGRVPAGEDPHEIEAASDGKFAYITNYGAFSVPQHTISVVDLAAQKALPAIDLGPLRAPHGITRAEDKFYFTAEGSKAIARLDPATGRVDWLLGLGQDRTHMLAVGNNNAIFTSNVNSNTIAIIEPDPKADASGRHISLIQVGKGPEGFDVSPDGRELWAANSHEGTVSVIDVAAKQVTQSFSVSTKMSNRLKFTLDGKMVLISDLGTGDLVIIDAAERREIKRLKVGNAAAGILIAPDGDHAYVAAPRDSSVAVVDIKTLSIVGRIETGRGPDGMAWVK